MAASSVDPAPEVISVGPAHVIATWKGFLLQIWRGETSLEAARHVRAAASRLAARHQGAIASLVIVEPLAPLPEREVRTELSGMVVDQAGRMVALAMVHEGEGFRAAAVRAVMTGLMAVARNPFPHHVTSTVAEARAWLARERRLSAPDIAALQEVVEELRARIG